MKLLKGWRQIVVAAHAKNQGIGFETEKAVLQNGNFKQEWMKVVMIVQLTKAGLLARFSSMRSVAPRVDHNPITDEEAQASAGGT